MKKLLICWLIIFTSCENVNHVEQEIAGTYDAYIIGAYNPFLLKIDFSEDNRLFIEAPFDNQVWSYVELDYNETHPHIYALNIPYQSSGAGTFIWGSGVYDNGYLQLYYSMQFGDFYADYSIEGYQIN